MLPNFGEFKKERARLQAKIKQEQGPIADADVQKVAEIRPAPEPSAAAPSVAAVVGRALPMIGTYGDLDNKQQKVALIDEEMCINCGKCYMTCNDSGYQAITFDAETHLPHITDECTGCTLCVSVCPILDCIKMVERETPYTPKVSVSRGRADTWPALYSPC
jgi:dihydropyrimidine dehydrogenase (NADP+)